MIETISNYWSYERAYSSVRYNYPFQEFILILHHVHLHQVRDSRRSSAVLEGAQNTTNNITTKPEFFDYLTSHCHQCILRWYRRGVGISRERYETASTSHAQFCARSTFWMIVHNTPKCLASQATTNNKGRPNNTCLHYSNRKIITFFK